MCVLVTSLHTGEEFESISKFLVGNRFHVKIDFLLKFAD